MSSLLNLVPLHLFFSPLAFSLGIENLQFLLFIVRYRLNFLFLRVSPSVRHKLLHWVRSKALLVAYDLRSRSSHCFFGLSRGLRHRAVLATDTDLADDLAASWHRQSLHGTICWAWGSTEAFACPSLVGPAHISLVLTSTHFNKRPCSGQWFCILFPLGTWVSFSYTEPSPLGPGITNSVLS